MSCSTAFRRNEPTGSQVVLPTDMFVLSIPKGEDRVNAGLQLDANSTNLQSNIRIAQLPTLRYRHRMNSSLTGKNIFLTGCTGGLGTALSLALANRKVKLFGTDLPGCEEKLAHWKEMASKAGCRLVVTSAVDVCDASSLKNVLTNLQTSHGHMDVVIANAGVGWDTPATRFDPEVFRKQVDINLNGVANTFAPVLSSMIERKAGHLVAIASLAGYRGLPELTGYCASKAGVIAFLDGLRLELKPYGIRCTTISPGWMNTGVVHTLSGPKPAVRSVDQSAEKIVQAIERGHAYYAFPWWLRALLNLNRASFTSLSDPMARLFIKLLTGKRT